MSAVSVGSDSQIPLLITYALERLIYIILVSCHVKALRGFKHLMLIIKIKIFLII